MAELVDTIRTGCILGEGPLWDDASNCLWWTDIQALRLYQWSAAAGVSWTQTPERLGAFACMEDDPRFIAAFETGFALFDPQVGKINWLARPERLGSGRRFNDGRVDPQGRFWSGTMVENAARAGADSAALYRLDANGLATQHITGVGISNGLCWSPDGATLYFADSPRRTIWAYDFDLDDGALSNRRVFASTEEGAYPDGAVTDADGCLWSAQWGASRVVRYRPDGAVAEILAVPTRQPSCPAFGGPDHDFLFVTSAAEGLDKGADPEAGSVFVFRVGAHGRPSPKYRYAGAGN